MLVNKSCAKIQKINPNFGDLDLLNLALPVLPMTFEHFSYLTGIDLGVVQGMAKRDYLPTIKIGRRRLINTPALIKQCLQSLESNNVLQ